MSSTAEGLNDPVSLVVGVLPSSLGRNHPVAFPNWALAYFEVPAQMCWPWSALHHDSCGVVPKQAWRDQVDTGSTPASSLGVHLLHL